MATAMTFHCNASDVIESETDFVNLFEQSLDENDFDGRVALNVETAPDGELVEADYPMDLVFSGESLGVYAVASVVVKVWVPECSEKRRVLGTVESCFVDFVRNRETKHYDLDFRFSLVEFLCFRDKDVYKFTARYSVSC